MIDIVNINFICPDDCGNAPKKRMLRDLLFAYGKKDTDFICEFMADNIQWNVVGGRTFQGKNAVLEQIKKGYLMNMIEIEILNIITHGKTASLNATITLEDKSQYHFCNVYTFVSAGKNTIKDITSYVIKT